MLGGRIDNIIFDLGGVIINLDESKTINRIARLSDQPLSDVKSKFHHFEAYKLFEKGLLSEDEFREAVRTYFEVECEDLEIDDCMNAMLLDIPVERVELLKSLNSFNLFLLSNTNSIHLKRFDEILSATTGDNKIDRYFTKAYYSHYVQMRKPDKEIFELVISENNLNPSRTIFLDDNLTNLKGAETVGIQTFHVKNPAQLFELFS